jgi:mono/diheme cytochrome c family protein
MRAVSFVCVVLMSVVVGMGIVNAGGKASAAKGEELFNDPKLGTTGSSCNTCHGGGKGLEGAGSRKQWFTEGKAHDTLEETVNHCITTGLQGKPLKVKSIEMQSLVLYIRSLMK